ncbi:hypothetical protein GCM10020000_01470 [Streptomyces olivoverticillatus]
MLYAVPVAALALDAVLLGAVPGPTAALGGVIVLAGVALAAIRRAPARTAAPSRQVARGGPAQPELSHHRIHGRARRLDRLSPPGTSFSNRPCDRLTAARKARVVAGLRPRPHRAPPAPLL